MLRAFSAILIAFGLPPWMARAVARVATWYAVLLLGITVVKSGTNALFLARGDPARLPFLYVAVAVTVLLVTSLVGRRLGRATPGTVLGQAVVTATGLFLVMVVLVVLDVPYASGALYVLGEVYATALSILFWARVTDAFSPRNLRRAVGPISAGGMAGSVVGGLLMSASAEVVGVLFPLVVSVGAAAAALPLMSGLRSRSRRSLAEDRPGLRVATRYLLTGSFPLLVGVLVAGLAALGAAVDFLFRLEAAGVGSEDRMAVLFGLLNAGVGVVVVVVQSLVTPRLLARLGLFWFAAIVPMLVLALTGVWTLAWPSFGLLLVVKGLEMAGAFSLYNASITLLYNPMPTALRSQMRTLIDGAVKKGGAAAAGLVLGVVALSTWERAPTKADVLAPVVMGLAALCLGLLPVLRRRYLAELEERLGRRRRQAVSPESVIDPADRATREALIAALDDPEPEHVLAALQALGADFDLYPERMVQMLRHRDERVREEALRHVPARRDLALTALLLTEIAEESARRPREEAIRALAKTAPGEGLAAPYLDDDDPGAVCAAIEVCLLADAATRDHAAAKLASLAAAPEALSPPFRRELARLLGRLEDRRFDPALLVLLDDEDLSVRRLAIEAAGREKNPLHLGALISALGDRGTRVAAREALIAYTDQATAALSEALDDVRVPLSVRIHLPRVLAGIGTDDAARALLYSNPKDDAYLQQRIADRLAEIASHRPDLTLGRDRAAQAVERRLTAWLAYDEASAEVAAIAAPEEQDAARAHRLLLRVLRWRRDQNLRIALQLLGLHRGLDRMMSAYRALVGASKDGASRQDAVELLDNALAGDPLRPHLVGLLERREPLRTDSHGRARVAALCRSKDPLVRATARSLAPRFGQSAFSDGESFRAIAAGAEELEGQDMPAPVVERLLFLENVDLFEGLGVDDLAAIAAISTEEVRGAGERIYGANDVGDCMYIVVEGRVQLSRGGEPLFELAPGESLGQVSFLDRGPRPVDARVAGSGHARLIRIERGAFLDLLSDRPGLMHAFFGVIAARLRALIDRDLQKGASS